MAARRFDISRSTLRAASPFSCAVGGDCREFVIRVRIGLAREHGLDQALGHDVRKAAVGSGRVSVILDRQAEVARRGIAGALENVFSGADQLDDSKREVSKMIGVGGFALQEKIVQRFGIRVGRKFLAVRCGELNDAVPALRLFHDATQR